MLINGTTNAAGVDMLKYAPAVFAVGNTYQIMVFVDRPSLMWVTVGGSCWYDDTNGILRSDMRIHRITVPARALESARGYTVCEREIIERRAYHTLSGDEKRYSFAFRPVEGPGPVRAFHISDTHSLYEEPLRAAAAFGEADLLILNGDLPDRSENADDLGIVYRIADGITRGEKPIVFSRGNHDMRGANAEVFSACTPNCDGRTYYSFRLGPVWGLVLDCGEDKEDSHPEYGHTVCCHAFRLRETDLIRGVIEHADTEYLAPGVKYRVIISHIPFTRLFEGEFGIEKDLYAEWTQLIGRIGPHVMIHGHTHRIGVYFPGGDYDSYGVQPCPVVTASHLSREYFAGCGFTFGDDGILVTAVSSLGETLMSERIGVTGSDQKK